MSPDIEKVTLRLQNLCARQECCCKDILGKALKKLDGDIDAASSVLQKLRDDGFVDDLRYAGAFCRDKSSLAGWGPHKIRFALRSKGISEELIEEALKETDSRKSFDRLSQILAVKAKSLASDPQSRLKLIRFALSRGYDYSQVERAIADLNL